MDDEVLRLLREERVVAAAELASRRGDAHTASLLFERACDFQRAAAEAERAGEHARSLQVALDGNDDATAERALSHVVKNANEAERLAIQLEQRGHPGWAARLFEGIGKRAAAARAYERAGLAIKAADLFEAEGEVAAAARALETQIRKAPDSFAAYVALGGLLLRFGKVEAAVRSLQKVPEGSPERREAIALLLVALDRLGLAEARLEAERELASLGGAPGIEVPNATELHPRLFGRYEVVRQVAASPSARLLECIDAVRTERVAVKIFAAYDARGAGRDAFVRFEREVRVTGTLDHPNIVPLLDYVAEGPAIVLAWMGRGTLEQMIARESLTPARAVEIASCVLAALGEAHRLGILHRDVKPANVLFDEAGTARLGDFGVAHLGDLSTTVTAGVIGTLGYMSPEQREGRPATVQSDLYAVGVMLWEMLTGERVEVDFNACTLHISPSAMHPDLSVRHDRAVLAMLAVDPAERPADAFAARHALGALAWPDTVERAAHPRPAIAKSLPPTAARLQLGDDGIAIDQWLDRRVVTLPLDAAVLARVSAFARADHPALQSVLRVDRESNTVWLAAPRGAPLVGRLGARRAEILWEGLVRLHQMGEIHGHVDRDHVLVDDAGGVTLLFAKSAGAARTSPVDRLDLISLI
ncbi:MAG: serine/threonine protein kinase [Polyangiaceae bacterium]|nr:serine/threonine protein kinase [Polyangiaceae bacterium]